jgi:hypothetical protein
MHFLNFQISGTISNLTVSTVYHILDVLSRAKKLLVVVQFENDGRGAAKKFN